MRSLCKGNTLGFEVDRCFTTGSQGRSKLIQRAYKKREEGENEGSEELEMENGRLKMSKNVELHAFVAKYLLVSFSRGRLGRFVYFGLDR